MKMCIRDRANIKELKKRGLALRAIKELVPRISRTAPGTTASKVKLLEDEQPEREKILEFQKIMERLIAQELHMKKEGEDPVSYTHLDVYKRQYVGCAVIILRCHRPFIVNELIAFANQYDSLEKRILEELAVPYADVYKRQGYGEL